MTKCKYSETCTGCTLWNIPYAEQKNNKISYLSGLIRANGLNYDQEIDFISLGDRGLRHRTDFTLSYNEETKKHDVGFYNQHKQLLSIEQCLQFSPSLQAVYSDFTQSQFYYGNTPIKKASVRLRVGPNNNKACWLDFSNLEIKNLLEDQKLINTLIDRNYIIEIGQKGKTPKLINQKIKLVESEPKEIFQTVNSTGDSINLEGLISDFTQPSYVTASALVKKILDYVIQHSDISSVLEFGPGIGQFTLGFLSLNKKVTACEINKSACKHLLLNAKTNFLDGKLTILEGDFQNLRNKIELQCDLAFVNPARSGLKGFTSAILETSAKYVIYVSCFPLSMIQDIKKLSSCYKLCNIIIVDQFPQTEHFETIVMLEKL